VEHFARVVIVVVLAAATILAMLADADEHR
jgi:hypothetical protein